MDNRIFKVTQSLPDEGKRVLCYGYHTHCCTEDMDETRQWHEVTFSFEVSEYKLKKEIPLDLEESILEFIKVYEHWRCGEEFQDGFVIGVTEWKHI